MQSINLQHLGSKLSQKVIDNKVQQQRGVLNMKPYEMNGWLLLVIWIMVTDESNVKQSHISDKPKNTENAVTPHSWCTNYDGVTCNYGSKIRAWICMREHMLKFIPGWGNLKKTLQYTHVTILVPSVGLATTNFLLSKPCFFNVVFIYFTYFFNSCICHQRNTNTV